MALGVKHPAPPDFAARAARPGNSEPKLNAA